jgi:maltokinase
VTSLTPLPWYTAGGQWPAVRSELAEITYAEGEVETYQLLVGYRLEGSATDEPPLARVWLDGFGRVEMFDATNDAQARVALVAALVGSAEPGMSWLDRSWFNPRQSVAVFSGEQSNTNLLIGGSALIKVFRRLEPGPNLDAEMLATLNGSGYTPALYGVLSHAGTDLAMACELVAAAADGWSLATQSCADGADFTSAATELGRTLSRLHRRLATAYPTEVRPGGEIASQMCQRLAVAVSEAPELAQFAAQLAAAFAALGNQPIPVQRIHRDFHLGQALRRSESGSWVIIDFEGEPLTSSAERRKLDSVWRDVAGALRSFDYARSAHPDPNSAAARSWVAATRQAFLTGYLDSAAAPPAVLRAYQLDKAVYEVRYELRNRPEWAYIPLGSVQDELTGFSGEPPVLA